MAAAASPIFWDVPVLFLRGSGLAHVCTPRSETAAEAEAEAAARVASLREEGERAVAERLARREAFAARATEVSDLAWEAAARAGVGSIPIS